VIVQVMENGPYRPEPLQGNADVHGRGFAAEGVFRGHAWRCGHGARG